MNEILRTDYPDLYKTDLANNGLFYDKGYKIHAGEEDYFLKTDPQKLTNSKAAFAQIESSFLSDPILFFSRSDEEIISSLKQSNRILLKDLQHSNSQIKGGEYRTEGMIVFDGVNDPENPAEVLQAMKNAGATRRELKLARKVFEEAKKTKSLQKAISRSASRRKIWEKICFIPTQQDKIPEEMANFATHFKDHGLGVLEGRLDPVETAAWVHQEIGHIHPFWDANGRTARLWMNAMLQLGGKPAVVFPSDKIYTETVKKGTRYFANYLKTLIEVAKVG